MYTGETLNVSAVRLSSGDGRIGTDATTFRPLGDGSTFTVDPTSADFDGVEPGSYYVASDDDTHAELSVVRAGVGGIAATVTNGRTDPEHFDRLAIRVRYNFEAVDRLDVTVTGPSGDEVATTRIAESGKRVTVDIAEPTPGVYTVTAVGSNVDTASGTATVRVRGVTPTPTPAATATPTSTPTPTATTRHVHVDRHAHA